MTTPLNEIIEYKHEIMKSLKNSEEIIGLIADIPNIDMNSDEAYSVMDDNFYDYSYADETFQSDKAVIFVEVAMNRRPSIQFKGMKIQIEVICNKNYAKLDGKKFKGVIGNRRDNIACAISDVLENSDEFGIGSLMLTGCEPVSVPSGFTGIGLVFDAVDFADKDGYYDY